MWEARASPPLPPESYWGPKPAWITLISSLFYKSKIKKEHKENGRTPSPDNRRINRQPPQHRLRVFLSSLRQTAQLCLRGGGQIASLPRHPQ